ncbi:hypothetical protein JNUCC1_02909 [Lentibacillus sp. JNUCC-1]|uniref:IDEAL domain-containing protein n=1 Tax=Lentibacillus sp. JNUCC-1 TaxID=2654513 RepID=UPI0012E864B0|nr:IDEAL domain-containing protein [Lentibacillus sp. JNUCC-1]MUV39037.1 hypothetical protein [Lentibacillus sp. JNUCC-1]
MVSVRVLKPYYLKVDRDYIRVILAYQYFTIAINGEIYQFVPKKDREIIIDRKTQKIVNTDAVLTFQKGVEVKYVPMVDLISVPDFLIQLYAITKTYYKESDRLQEKSVDEAYTELIISELENMNVKREIDKALDNRDEQAFRDLVEQL